jgi:LCP family protein required for cell wall assembly
MSDAEHSSAQHLPSAYDRGGKRRGRARRAHTVGKVLLASVVTLAMLTGLSVAFFYRHLNGNLNVRDLSSQMYDRPDKVKVRGPKEPLNILVMGSDTREGAGNNIDGLTGGGERSDTTILVHLSADRKTAYGVSIPRDTLVDRPDCKSADGDTIPGASTVMWNEAFAVGGPACTMQQVEQLSGVRLDNYVVVDFAGFRDMVNAIDGVEVCIPEDINDSAHGITLEAGTRELMGEDALKYVRVRHIGDGSDIGRIARQQAFIAAMVSKVVSGGTLARVDRLVRFLNAATNSLTTDLKNIREIAQVGLQFKKIGLKKIQFVTVPWEYSTAQPGRVELLPEAEALWEKIRNDAPLGKLRQGAINAAEVPGASATPSPSASAPASEDPSQDSPPTSVTPSPTQSTSPSADAQDEEQQQALEQAGLCT